ncbi:MAG: hypothetical protein GXP55_03690, partial [Deltaproteobacteria bacterium]|nr:hypothetical protein [Deltaproteobacteria bacterium]
CDGIDNDCDGSIDEGLKHIFYADCDGDTFGDLANSRLACNEADAAPFFGVGCGGTSDATDCDDSCATCHPGGVEVCNGVDDDCDGAVDEGVRTSYYRDGDGDGFGAGGALLACSTPGGGYVTNVADCDDGNRNAFPGQTAYFTRPRSDGSYDYDCNAANNPQYSSQNTCYNGGSCRGGWVSLPAPTCGSTANFYATCSIAGGGGTLCAPPPVGAIRQTQGCR